MDPRDYQFDTSDLLTPALVIYPNVVRQNIARMLALVENRPDRWRPHLKTAKLGAVIRLLAQAGVTSAKCATTLELLVACQSGMKDVLVAYPHVGVNAERIASIASAFPEVCVSALVESSAQIQDWIETPVDLFIDINTGMDRTGMALDHPAAIADLALGIDAAGVRFRGLHFYDGQSTEPDLTERIRLAHLRYRQLLSLIRAIEEQNIKVGEVITSGTPAIPGALACTDLWDASFHHQLSPGTVVYNDLSSLRQLPESYGFRPAALVVSRVVSSPRPEIVTCDAGHKSLGVDSGVPHCMVLGQPAWEALKPSEEHLPLRVDSPQNSPPLGSLLYLLPRHVCPTVNNFDFAALVEGGAVVSSERVSARGHEGPLLSSPAGMG